MGVYYVISFEYLMTKLHSKLCDIYILGWPLYGVKKNLALRP